MLQGTAEHQADQPAGVSVREPVGGGRGRTTWRGARPCWCAPTESQPPPCCACWPGPAGWERSCACPPTSTPLACGSRTFWPDTCRRSHGAIRPTPTGRPLLPGQIANASASPGQIPDVLLHPIWSLRCVGQGRGLRRAADGHPSGRSTDRLMDRRIHQPDQGGRLQEEAAPAETSRPASPRSSALRSCSTLHNSNVSTPKEARRCDGYRASGPGW